MIVEQRMWVGRVPHLQDEEIAAIEVNGRQIAVVRVEGNDFYININE
jgi:hypothetical protein